MEGNNNSDDVIDRVSCITNTKIVERQVQLLALCSALLTIAEGRVARELLGPGSKRRKSESIKVLKAMQQSYLAMVRCINTTTHSTDRLFLFDKKIEVLMKTEGKTVDPIVRHLDLRDTESMEITTAIVPSIVTITYNIDDISIITTPDFEVGL